MITVSFQRLPAAAALFAAASLFAAPAAAFDEEQLQSIPGMGAAVPKVGSNIDGGSVFANYVNARRDGQLFLLLNSDIQYERPSTDAVAYNSVHWCSNLVFTEFENGDQPVGYTGRCVHAWLVDLSELQAAGAQITSPGTAGEFSHTSHTISISSVYVPQTNVFEGAFHKHTDNIVFRFWDDGRPVMPFSGWEVHDEGDTDPNAATSSLSVNGKLEWLSANDAAALFNLNVTELTPDAFNTIYDEVWSKTHAGIAVPE